MSDADSTLTHLDPHGRALMVDVGQKMHTERTATASANITMAVNTLKKIKQGDMAKGDVLAVAQVAGIMAAKQTSTLIPLCHPLALTGVAIEFTLPSDTTLHVEATVRTTGPTGVEMEALTAVSVCALTVYDMCKAIDRSMTIGDIKLLFKEGGKSGTYIHQGDASGSQ